MTETHNHMDSIDTTGNWFCTECLEPVEGPEDEDEGNEECPDVDELYVHMQRGGLSWPLK